MEQIDRVLSVLRTIEIIENLGNSADNILPRMPKIYIRNVFLQKPYEFYDESQFKRRYRFSKDTVKNVILPLIATRLERFNKRGLPIEPELQILIALRFYATGCFQTVCGDLISISQSTVCLIINRVSKALSQLLPKFIKFPRRLESVKHKFEELGRSRQNHGLYNIIGAIDCTHVKITRPRGIPHSEAYRNRKGYFSLNVQVIVGPNMEIYDIVTRWPGSSHDSRIFRNSQAYTRLMSGHLRGVLVGDSGYPSLPILLTPILQPLTDPEKKYNYAQITTRNVVERFFGVWKKIFPCLLNIRMKLQNISNVIIACAILHNIGQIYGDVYENEEQVQTDEYSSTMEAQNNTSSSTAGLAFRQSIIEQFH